MGLLGFHNLGTTPVSTDDFLVFTLESNVDGLELEDFSFDLYAANAHASNPHTISYNGFSQVNGTGGFVSHGTGSLFQAGGHPSRHGRTVCSTV